MEDDSITNTMTNIPSKEQVAKLSAEQQEVVGRIALDEAQARRLILAKAKNYRGYSLIPALIWLAFICAIARMQDSAVLLPLLIIGTLLYVEFHARGINSRIDATITLFNLDRSPDKPNLAKQDGDEQPPA